MRGQEHYRDVELFAHQAGSLHSVARTLQYNVHQDQVRRCPPDLRERLVAAGGDPRHGIPEGFQGHPDVLCHDALVFDDEDTCAHFSVLPRALRGRKEHGDAKGRRAFDRHRVAFHPLPSSSTMKIRVLIFQFSPGRSVAGKTTVTRKSGVRSICTVPFSCSVSSGTSCRPKDAPCRGALSAASTPAGFSTSRSHAGSARRRKAIRNSPSRVAAMVCFKEFETSSVSISAQGMAVSIGKTTDCTSRCTRTRSGVNPYACINCGTRRET